MLATAHNKRGLAWRPDHSGRCDRARCAVGGAGRGHTRGLAPQVLAKVVYRCLLPLTNRPHRSAPRCVPLHHPGR